ncbi:MAG: YggS family pyridoxal phosphate-dependent enzyme, partial [Acidobacteriota bacterium]
ILMLVLDIASNLKRLWGKIESIALACGRNPEEIRLLAVTKTLSPDFVERARRAGQMLFGENRVQEAEQKISLANAKGLEWHLIGPLQSNKAQRAVELFDVIQTLDRPKIAHKVNRYAAKTANRLPVFIEVNIGEEPQKHGVLPQELPSMVELIDSMPSLDLQGLMTIPPYHEESQASRPYYKKMFQLLAEVNRSRQKPLTELSMGMSHDYRIAIQEGATLLRVGTAIFGPRSQR